MFAYTYTMSEVVPAVVNTAEDGTRRGWGLVLRIVFTKNQTSSIAHALFKGRKISRLHFCTEI